MNAMQDQTPATNNKPSTLGFSLLLIAMAVGSLARSLHVSEAVSITMSCTSGAMSLAAIVLFIKSAKSPNRRRVLVLTLCAIMAAGVAFAYVATHR